MRELRALEPDFWRAPSAHNTQPWTLTYAADEVAVGWDPSRALPVSDPTGRDLRLSLGAFVECCLIVCADAGLSIGFHHDPGPLRVGFLRAAARPYETAFTTADVRARGANRGEYQPGGLPAETAERLTGMRRLACRDLEDLLHAADLHQFGDREVTRELRQWLRLTRRHRRYLLDGLSDRALALSRVEAFALRASLALYPALRRLGLPRVLAGASRGLLDYDGDVLVLVGPVDQEVEMGRLLMRHWLTLSGLGYTTHPLSQLIDDERTRAALAGLLDVADPRTLLHVARVGRPKAPAAPSARLRD
ncbi:nitroreductase [Nonomuraea zeae]|uniref:Nitroreductase n=1 Tax=Nonomuraea zeae TaxID=1642303 RepID=A0A5S4FKX7_9ACTN|nr:nitroreductase [Nonomuraea zeae]TMR21377.1 nitroreductase [Nonomuraea zeae]